MGEEFWADGESALPGHVPPKKCSRCLHVLPISKFRVLAEGRIKGQCRDCTTAQHRAWVKRNKDHLDSYQKRWAASKGEYHHERKLIRRYGITAKDYQDMLDSQGGVCAICGATETIKCRGLVPQKLSVDHCHETGKNRGLLCDRCNRGIGSFRDNQGLLVKAIEYLESHRESGETARPEAEQ